MRSGVGWAIVLCACSGSVDARPPVRDFDHGTEVLPGSGGAAGGGASLPVLPVRPYPSGPYGNGVGATIADFELLGWKDPKLSQYDPAKLEKLTLSDYYDPSGAGPIKLVWLSAHVVWCGPCNTIAMKMRDLGTADELRGKGVEPFATLFEDGKNPPGPASPQTLVNWGKKYQVDYPFAIDPAFVLAPYFPADLIPANVLIETKGMRIVASSVGADLDKVLEQIDTALAGL